MTEHGDAASNVGGIDPRFERFPIRGVQLEALGHDSRRRSQTLPATRMTTARRAEAIRRRRVCIGQRG